MISLGPFFGISLSGSTLAYFQCACYRAFSLTWPASMQIYWNNILELECDTNMAAVSLFWDTNMAAVTSCENTLYMIFVKGMLSQSSY